MNLPQRLGRNLGGYQGERIDIAGTLAGIRQAALATGWHEEVLLPGSDRELICLRRPPVRTERAVRLYISAGIHGDEPAGPLALATLFERDLWPRDVDLWICPCLNPTGMARSTRENDIGIDLNRDYLQPDSTEVRAHIQWLEKQPAFDGVLCLHEDWEAHGFYCYELGPTHGTSIAEKIVAAVVDICPIDANEVIDGRAATAPGIIRPSIDPASRPKWPEAFWIWQRWQGRSLTLEAPSDFPLPVRVQALVTATQIALREFAAGGDLRG